jgi:hypothetical protein
MNERPEARIVDLVTTAEPALAAPTSHHWPLILAVLAAAIALACFILLLRRFNTRDPAETAFRKLSRTLHLPRKEQRHLRDAALRAGVPPVALLLSAHARTQCVAPAR